MPRTIDGNIKSSGITNTNENENIMREENSVCEPSTQDDYNWEIIRQQSIGKVAYHKSVSKRTSATLWVASPNRCFGETNSKRPVQSQPV